MVKKRREEDMPVMEHLSELRLRLAISAVALFIAAVVCFAYIDLIRVVITRPLNDVNLIYLTPPEAFIANIRIAVISGFIISLPVIIYQLSAYIFPALSKSERILYLSTLFGVLILFTCAILLRTLLFSPWLLTFSCSSARPSYCPCLQSANISPSSSRSTSPSALFFSFPSSPGPSAK